MPENTVVRVSGPSVSLSTLLLVLFVALKLTGHIDWAWVWVLSPLWIPMTILLAIVAVGAACIGAAYLIERFWG